LKLAIQVPDRLAWRGRRVGIGTGAFWLAAICARAAAWSHGFNGAYEVDRRRLCGSE
jgi:hypothetical protein